ncbi:hypothetical protein [Pandoraea fibrosis]|uniref:Uncharacterized protein n=1 Tax=Pandoraea fibrosis TaxID=1891094 RepID=A0A5E4SZ37_9BURK|nr:hypothetical protein [Pandoraea fibrosis]VVD81136.1 hypothetical protein PFI31113_01117 [Pandoraea fibrosis]
MSRLTPNTHAAGSLHARRIRSVRAVVGAGSALLLALVAGCAQLQIPPPDAPAARLPQAPDAPAMTDAQKQDLTRLNQRIYDEQETTIERERAQRALDDALRSYNSNAYFYGGWGSPGWYGPGWYGPGGYGPRSSVGIGFGF